MSNKPTNGLRVLVIDDDPESRIVVTTVLKHHGYEAIPAVNGIEGVELAKAVKPQLILMDLMMPEMDGLKAAEVLRSDPETREIPIWAVSAHDANDADMQKIGALFTQYVKKPFRLKEFLDSIARQFGSSEGHAASDM